MHNTWNLRVQFVQCSSHNMVVHRSIISNDKLTLRCPRQGPVSLFNYLFIFLLRVLFHHAIVLSSVHTVYPPPISQVSVSSRHLFTCPSLVSLQIDNRPYVKQGLSKY